NRDHARLRHRDGGDLVERHVGTIGLDLDGVEKVARRAAGPQRAEVVLEGADRALHAPLNVVEISAFHLCLLEPSRSDSSWSALLSRLPENRLARFGML